MKKVIDFSSLYKIPLRALKNFFAPGSFGKVRFQSIVALFLAILVAFYVFPIAWNRTADFVKEKTKIELPHLRQTDFHFGLDLLGGTHLVYEADTSKISSGDRDDALEGSRDVIERRINALGVAEPLVQTNYSGDKQRIIVELAGIKDASVAIKQIGETPILQFKEQSETPTRALNEEQKKEMEKYNQEAKTKANGLLSRVLQGENFGELAFQHSEDAGSREKRGELDWFREGMMVPEFEEAVKSLKDNEISKKLVQTKFGFHLIRRTGFRQIEEEGKKIKEYRASHILIRTKSERDYLTPDDYWLESRLSGKHLTRASVQFDSQTNAPEVALQFNSEGAELFKELTERNVGKLVGIFLDGQPITIPRVNEPIRDGSARITGDYDLTEAKLLARRLNAGALPVPIKLVSQQTVDASLGKVSVEKSFKAGLYGFVLVALFMLLYYRLAGLISVLALLIYAVLSLAIFKFIPVTLTLAGIAGFILSIGMAVDANVLVFERLKEELREGKIMTYAVSEAFGRAWPSIRDGNITTLFTSLILFWFSTSLIRGFALTLSLGILMSMFTVMVISRIFLKCLASFISNRRWMIGR